MARTEMPAKGLYKNGAKWWVRTVRGPITGTTKPRSTGTADVRLANRIVAMLEELAENRPQWEWLELAAAGEVALLDLYNHRAAGTLHELRAAREAAAVAANDVDVEPWVQRWYDEHLALRVAGGELSHGQAADYVRQLRALIPASRPFPRSQFTEDTVKARLLALTDARSGRPLSGSTRRAYLMAWELFYRFARKRVPLTVNPFEEVDEWRPSGGKARQTAWDHDTRVAVLDRMEGEARVYLALVLGSGAEEGAVDAMRGAHVGQLLDDGRLLITVPGTKNAYREDRTIFVDAWATKIVWPHARTVLPRAPLFTISSDVVRQRFYEAQVAAKLIDEPPMSKSHKRLWKEVNPHTIHDARHTYVVCRILGLDGEPRRDLKFCATQLGHGDEQMVMRIYGKLNLRERLKLIELAEAKRQGAEQAREAR